jgi:ABC-2 type transport system permease protein
MSDLRLCLTLTGFAVRDLLRSRWAVLVTIVLPVAVIALLTGLGADDATTVVVGDPIDLEAYYLSGMIAFVIMMSSFGVLSVGLVSRRETGQLKRLRGTPMPPWTYMVAQLSRSILLVLALALVFALLAAFVSGDLTFTTGDTATQVQVDAGGLAAVGFLIYAVLGIAAMSALGIAFTVLVTSARAAWRIGPAIPIALAFVSGVFIPVANLPPSLVEIGQAFPLAHLAEGLQSTSAQGASGLALSAGNVGVLVAYGLIGLAVALARFRWDPQAVRS